MLKWGVGAMLETAFPASPTPQVRGQRTVSGTPLGRAVRVLNVPHSCMRHLEPGEGASVGSIEKPDPQPLEFGRHED